MDVNRAKKSRRDSKRFLGLVDIVYAVIIAISFVNASVRWPGGISVANAAVALSYGAVVASWIGYHRSIAVHWHISSARYPFDLLILFDFWLIFVNFDHMQSLLWAYVALLVTYIGWGVAKSFEWGTKYDHYLKDSVVVIVTIALALLYAHAPETFKLGTLGSCPTGYLFLLAVAGILVWYWNHWRPGHERPQRDCEHTEALKSRREEAATSGSTKTTTGTGA